MLGKFIWKFGKPFAKLLFNIPKSYQCHMMIFLENHIHIWCLFFALSFVKLLWPLRELFSCFHWALHGLSKKIYGHMKVQYKKRKKMWAHEGPWKKKTKKGKKDSHALKRIYLGREIIQKEFPFHPSQSMHVLILIWLYDLFFSLDPVFDFAIYAIQVCLILIPYLELHI